MTPRSPRDAYLRGRYGITEEQYEAVLEAQGGRCAICRMKPRTKKLQVEHDHRTMRILGLCCRACNGYLLARCGRDPDKYRRAALYLEAPPAYDVLPADHRCPPQANDSGFKRRRR